MCSRGGNSHDGTGATGHLQLACFSLFLCRCSLAGTSSRQDLGCVPGKPREADGYDETVLEGEREDSVDDAGFEHPYGRGSVRPRASSPSRRTRSPRCLACCSMDVV